MEKRNKEVEVTRFVNINTIDPTFTFYVAGQPRTLNAGEEKIYPVFVAELGAKHLIDLILQRDYNIKDTLRDTDLRKTLLSKILPDEATRVEYKPLTQEEFAKKLEEELKKQGETISGLSKKVDETTSEKDKEIEKLKKQISDLEKGQKEKVAKKSK
jgi:uncharacterized coiled-coil protein SlyX